MSFVPTIHTLELYDDVAGTLSLLLYSKGSDVSGVAPKQMTEKRGQKLD